MAVGLTFRLYSSYETISVLEVVLNLLFQSEATWY